MIILAILYRVHKAIHPKGTYSFIPMNDVIYELELDWSRSFKLSVHTHDKSTSLARTHDILPLRP